MLSNKWLLRGLYLSLALVLILTPDAGAAQESAMGGGTAVCTTCDTYDNFFCDSGVCHRHGGFGMLADNVQNHANGDGWPYGCTPQHTHMSSCSTTAAEVLALAEKLDAALYSRRTQAQTGLSLNGAKLSLVADRNRIEVSKWCPIAKQTISVSVPLAGETIQRAAALVSATSIAVSAGSLTRSWFDVSNGLQ